MIKMDLIKKAKIQEESGDIDAAINTLKSELNNNPKNILIQIEIGNLYASIKNYEEASGFFRRSIRVFPDNKEVMDALCFCLCEIGNKYQSDRQYSLAEAAFEELLNYQPNNPDYLFNLGNALYSQNKFEKASTIYNKSLSFQKDENTLNNLANSYRKLGKYDDAINNYLEAISINTSLIHSRIELTHLKQNLCDWRNINNNYEEIKNHIRAKKDGIISPFTVLSMPYLGLEDQLAVASKWSQQKKVTPFNEKIKFNDKKISIGYLSADFRNHPLYYLIYDVLKNHNTNKFDIKLYYSGPSEDSEQHSSFRKLNAEFINISELTDKDCAKKIKNDNIDILVDLSGYTGNSRSIITAYRPARVHVNWLGFAGTMGYYFENSLYDFIFADNYIIPKKLEKFYSEKIIKLPHCYQPNIQFRPKITPQNKEDFGFKKSSFIFASFCQSIKITEEIFCVWLDLLNNTKKTSLWLLESNDYSNKNLHDYADKYGVDKSRIVFAPKVNFTEHIKRHQIVDLFLDTFPYNAHTSTSDAIWAECPVLTISGDTFASRVAGSILTEVKCIDLITHNKKNYYNKALELYNNPDQLLKIKEQIIAGKNKSNLFNPNQFCKNIEKIYQQLLSC